MARGRMINSKITSDILINKLSDDTSRLAFTWLIAFADVEGRTYGDPAMLRSMLFPRRDDVSIEQISKYIAEWEESGLVIWYEAEGDKWIQVPSFTKNQPNLRKEREQTRDIPAPELVRSDDGVTPEQLPVKLREEKLREEKRSSAQKPAAAAFLSSFQAQDILTTITGWSRIPGNTPDSANALGAVVDIVRVRGSPAGEEWIRSCFEEFRERYPRSTKIFWLTDWAVQGVIPPKGKPPDGRPKTGVSDDELRAAGYDLR